MQLQELQFEHEGVPATYYRGGKGLPVLLLHGSGPGASSLGNWRSVLEPLSERYEIFAMDLIGFGKSGRKPQRPYFDYPLWVRQAGAMLSRIARQKVGIIGHSLSGSIALTLAAADARVAGVVTTGAMGARFEPNELTRRTWTCPASREELVAALNGLVFNRSLITDSYISAREPVVFAPGYAEYFNSMFEGDLQKYADAAVLPPRVLAAIRCPVLMIHGRDDLAFPSASTLGIAKDIAQADVVLLGRCSHSVAFEHSAKFLDLVDTFFAGVEPSKAH
jgi:2-hydroxymuconate-semialdehyde hydrolase